MAIARATAAPTPAAKRFPDITADIVAVGGGTAPGDVREPFGEIGRAHV